MSRLFFSIYTYGIAACNFIFMFYNFGYVVRKLSSTVKRQQGKIFVYFFEPCRSFLVRLKIVFDCLEKHGQKFFNFFFVFTGRMTVIAPLKDTESLIGFLLKLFGFFRLRFWGLFIEKSGLIVNIYVLPPKLIKGKHKIFCWLINSEFISRVCIF